MSKVEKIQLKLKVKPNRYGMKGEPSWKLMKVVTGWSSQRSRRLDLGPKVED